MAVDLDSLSPYKSLLICIAPKNWDRSAATAELAQSVSAMDGVVAPSAVDNNPPRHKVAASFFYYGVQGSPFWLANNDLIDRVHELVMVLQRSESVVFLASEKRVREKILRLVAKADGSEMGKLKLVPRTMLNAAFVRGDMKTAWTTSTARRTDTRADNKVLGGPNVKHCLDPSVDQTYSLAASVNKLPGDAFGQPIGAAPRKGNIWAGASADGNALCKDVATLLDILKTHRKKPVANPVPGLAHDIDDPAALKSVGEAFSAALIPPELLEQDLDPAVRANADKWSRLEFDIAKTDGLGFDAVASLNTGSGASTQLGSIRVAFDAANPTSITPTATSLKVSKGTDALHDEAIDAINHNPDWIRVWYASGHALGGGAVSSNRFRQMPFEYAWIDFEDYDVTEEKPTPLQPQTFGKQKSLFCWVVNKWSRSPGKSPPQKGWLACNDGSLEIADFIHLGDGGGIPELTLIHAKGSGNGNANRPVAVGDFELVVSQAQKNLSFLDNMTTADEFTEFLGKGIKDAVFNDGVLAKRDDMLKALRKIASGDYRRRVVILQPRVTKTALAAARAAKNKRQTRIVQQLDLLLIGLQARCLGFGAELVVSGHDC